jgi:hypothetical protein
MVRVLKPKGQIKRVDGFKAEPAKAPTKKVEFDQREESLRTLSQFFLGEMDLKMRMRQMSLATGKQPQEWMATLEILKDNIMKTEHPDLKLKMYQGMVDLLAKVGQKEDLFVIQQIIARYNLKSFKDIGFEKVEVEVAKDACPVCRKMAGKKFSIAEAMETMPIPCHECGTEVDTVKGYCRCRYYAVF